MPSSTRRSRGWPISLRPGDLLVVNDTRVFPARLVGHRVPSGGAVECLLLRKLPDAPDLPDPGSRIPSPEDWEALMHPGQKLKPGARVLFERDDLQVHGEVLARHFQGRRTIRLWAESGGMALADAIERIGHIPLPPYIARPDEASDRVRYQTVYAREAGSVAAPTAGLHFTDRVLDELRTRGVERVSLTLHVGYGTFKPVRVENVDEHEVDPEFYTVSPSTAEALTNALQTGRRIIAVGTTTTRALESLTVDAFRSRAAVRWQHLVVHSSLPSLSRSAGSHHELSPAAVVAPDTGRGIRWPRADPYRVSRGCRSQISLLQLRRRDADCVRVVVSVLSPQSAVSSPEPETVDLSRPRAKPYY